MTKEELAELAMLRIENTRLRVQNRLTRVEAWLWNWENFKNRIELRWLRMRLAWKHFQLWLRGLR